MSTSRNRVAMVAVVAAVALLSVGATAYAAEQGQLAGSTAESTAESIAGSSTGPTPSAPAPTPTQSASPSPSPSVTAVPDPYPTQPAAAPDDATADSAIPTTIADREYFYGLVTQCMAEAGFDWQAVIAQSDGSFSGVNFTHVGDIDPALQAGFTLALYGDTGGGDYYHWADAGCWGYAVHVTGNDGNN